MRVIKIGGNELNKQAFLQQLATTVAALTVREPIVIVHGGGQAIAEIHSALGLPILKVDGLRVTSARSLQLAEMVLSGQANKQLVRALLSAGVDAIGISGVDGGLLQAEPKHHPSADLGYVGTIVAVRSELLAQLLNLKITPVVSPISLGRDGHSYNVNADEAATALAAALEAEQFDFVSNVPGVIANGAVLSELTVAETQALIEDGTIYGGMIPKVKAALAAVAAGVSRVRIVDLDSLLGGGGTQFNRAEH